jgi:ubiquinone/menaquinone biosynthesis C-methylase UbiE
MPNIEKHYTRANLFDTIIQALEKEGIQKNQITRTAIAAVDAFHVRGIEVSRELAIKARLQPGMRVLDIGCGPGGTCRMLAGEFGCEVTGIDITAEYIYTAQQLSVLTGFQHTTRFVQGDALNLPFAGASFDIVLSEHVQMNIADKQAFYANIKRVLAPNGRFIYYDVLSKDHQPLHFPVPWSPDDSLNFLTTADELHDLLQHAGLQRIQVTDETQKGIDFFNRLLNRIAQKGLPAAGVHLLMGNDAVDKLVNFHRNLVEEKILMESGIYGTTK